MGRYRIKCIDTEEQLGNSGGFVNQYELQQHMPTADGLEAWNEVDEFWETDHQRAIAYARTLVKRRNDAQKAKQTAVGYTEEFDA